jgi:hypothetical protein
MGVRDANGPFVKLHQHRHQLGRVAHDFSPHAALKFGPCSGVAVKVVHRSALVGEKAIFSATIASQICFETLVHYVVTCISKLFDGWVHQDSPAWPTTPASL